MESPSFPSPSFKSDVIRLTHCFPINSTPYSTKSSTRHESALAKTNLKISSSWHIQSIANNLWQFAKLGKYGNKRRFIKRDRVVNYIKYVVYGNSWSYLFLTVLLLLMMTFAPLWIINCTLCPPWRHKIIYFCFNLTHKMRLKSHKFSVNDTSAKMKYEIN